MDQIKWKLNTLPIADDNEKQKGIEFLRDKEISLEKVKEEIKELKKELHKIEKSKEAVIQLGKICEKYNTLAKPEDCLSIDEKNSGLEIYNNLLK